MFIEKYRKGINITIVAFLCFLIVSLFTVTPGDEETPVMEFNAEQTAAFSTSGYSIIQKSDGGWTYQPTNDDPQLYISVSGEELRKVTVRFAEEVDFQSIRIYYDSKGAGAISESNSVVAQLQADKKTVVSYLPLDNYNVLRFDIDGPFEFESIKLSLCEDVLNLNVVPLITIAVIIAASVIFEKRLRLYSSIKDFILKEIESSKRLRSKKDVAVFVIRQLSHFCLLSLCVLMTVIIGGVFISKGLIIAVAIFATFTLFVNLMYRTLFCKEQNVAVLFLLIALIFGMVMCYSMPITTWNSWDEEFHYGKSVDLKNLFFKSQSEADVLQEQRVYATLDVYLSNIKAQIDRMHVQSTISVPTQTATVSTLMIAYIPYAFIMLLADLFGTGYFAEIVLAKFFNVCLISLVIFFGIKKIKSGKLIFACVALIPSLMFMTASFSYDPWIVAFISYGYACFISEQQNPDRKMTVKSTAIMLSAMILGCFAKLVYLFMIIPLLFMPKQKFESKKGRRAYTVACICSMLILLFIMFVPFLLNTSVSTDDRGGVGVDSAAQFMFILKNPIKYAAILLEFMGKYIAFDNMNGYTANYYLLGNSRSFFGTLTILVVFLCAFIDKKEDYDLFCDRPVMKISTLVALFLQIAAMASALYISFTPVALDTVLGCQYRYMFPLFIPVMFLLGTPKIKCNLSAKTVNVIVFGLLFFNLILSFGEVYLSKMFV